MRCNMGREKKIRWGEIPLLVLMGIVLKHFRPKTPPPPNKFIFNQPAQQAAQAQHRHRYPLSEAFGRGRVSAREQCEANQSPGHSKLNPGFFLLSPLGSLTLLSPPAKR